MRRSSAEQPQAKKVLKPLVIKPSAKHLHRSSIGDKVSRYRRGHLAHLDAVHQQRASLLPDLLRTRGSSGFYNAHQGSQPSGTTYDFREGTHDARGSYEIETTGRSPKGTGDVANLRHLWCTSTAGLKDHSQALFNDPSSQLAKMSVESTGRGSDRYNFAVAR